MRMLMTIRLAHNAFNAAKKDGSLSAKMDRLMAATKPEAAYFIAQCGQRTAVLIIDLPDPSKIPALVEPWFLTFQADVDIQPVMTPEDLKKAGLAEIGKQWA